MGRKGMLKAGLSTLLAATIIFTTAPAAGVSSVAQADEKSRRASEEVASLENGYYLTVYSTETDFYEKADNLEQETRSVYMAASRDGKEFEVLNNGGGVIFSKNTKGTLDRKSVV